jgi:hypothetical protein
VDIIEYSAQAAASFMPQASPGLAGAAGEGQHGRAPCGPPVLLGCDRLDDEIESLAGLGTEVINALEMLTGLFQKQSSSGKITVHEGPRKRRPQKALSMHG